MLAANAAWKTTGIKCELDALVYLKYGGDGMLASIKQSNPPPSPLTLEIEA
jgi:hypothetical protein